MQKIIRFRHQHGFVPRCAGYEILPCMHADEIALLCKALKKSNVFLEFGAGQSTSFILQNFPNIIVHSVETDKNYIKTLSNLNNIKSCLKNKRLFIHYADIGNVQGWGYPVGEMNWKWLHYTLGFWSNFTATPDLALIDGRFRLCTSLLALLYLPSAAFCFHDFTNRPHYFELLKFIDINEINKTLIYYTRKNNVSTQRLMTAAFTAINDPR